jgi:hypothetical protein
MRKKPSLGENWRLKIVLKQSVAKGSVKVNHERRVDPCRRTESVSQPFSKMLLTRNELHRSAIQQMRLSATFGTASMICFRRRLIC